MLLDSKLKLITIFFVFCSLLTTTNSKAEEKLKIVATTTMIGDLVQNLIEDDLKLEILMGAGIDPHLYKPTRSDVLKMSQANLVLYHGLFLEGRMLDAFERLRTSGKKVKAVAENILLSNAQESIEPADPHIWMDPKLWNEVLSVILAELIALSPKHEQVFTARKNLYSEKLKLLDENSEKVLKTIPIEKRVLVTAHDAFHYFGLRYGFQVEGIQGISTESEAGVKDIERLVNILTQKKITAVFTESTVSEKNISALVDGVKNAGGEVKIGDSLYSDSMGNRGTYQGTYIGMIDHNISTITKFLGGDVPDTGIMSLENK